MISEVMLRAGLAEHWELADAKITVHNGGMNSATWFVSQNGRRWVAKAVRPAWARQFRAGLVIASRLQGAGIAAGAAVPTTDGQLATSVDGHPLALLRWVPGTPLTGLDERDQRLIGTTLARVHEVLTDVAIENIGPFHSVDPAAEHLAVRSWIRDPVADAVAALNELGLDSLSQGILHGDPAPEAFWREPGQDVCGLIDWSSVMSGPLLYDVASAAMYLGGPDHADALVTSYLERAALPASEVERGLLVMLRYRWAVQADYFAHRIVTNDLTGISDGAENEKGLEDARRWLTRLARA